MELFIQNLLGILAENIIELIFTVLGILISAFGVWVLNKIGKKEEIQGIKSATENVVNVAGITVGELQQTVVDELKNAATDGKLSKEEIDKLNKDLVNLTLEKMSVPVYNLLVSAGVDIIALIKGAGEDWINSLKAE